MRPPSNDRSGFPRHPRRDDSLLNGSIISATFSDRSRVWLGRSTAFALETIDEAPFDRRLVLATKPRGCWIVLTYTALAVSRPLRPMVRMMRGDGSAQDFVLPGAAQGRAFWLGYLPPDLVELRLAAEDRTGFVLERVGLRSHASLFAECLVKQPVRCGPALYHFARKDERRFRDILRGSCAVTPIAGYAAWVSARPSPAVPAGEGTAIRLILPARPADAPLVTETIASLQAQIHRSWTLVVAWAGTDAVPSDPGPADERVSHRLWSKTDRVGDLLADRSAVGLLDPGDCLTRDALALLSAGLASSDGVDMIYGDEEVGGSPNSSSQAGLEFGPRSVPGLPGDADTLCRRFPAGARRTTARPAGNVRS